MKSIIEIENLNFAYDQKMVIKDLNFTLNQGDYAGIIGSNGAGKTTLMKLILGQKKPSSGIIKIDGIDINKSNQWINIGYVSQSEDKEKKDFPGNVLEIVSLSLYKTIGLFKLPNRHHKQMALNALTLVRMQDYAKRPISKLSGGQRQRVMIAKALASKPNILIMDEPTTGIDKESTEHLFKLLEHMNKMHNLTILIISHDQIALKQNVNRIFEMDNGHLKELKEKEI